MIPKIFCSHCNAEIQRTDRFCPNCGNKIEWASDADMPASSERGATQSETHRCSMCGYINPSDASDCESCGGALPGKRVKKNPKSQTFNLKSQHSSSSKNPPSRVFQFLQSWKVTAGLAVIFIVVLVVIGTSHHERGHVHSPPTMSAQASQLLAEIEQLQQRVDANPDDMQATLQLANRLHDIKFYPRAIMLYERYVKLKPSDPAARVDLGICYFEMALTDSVRRSEYFTKAQEEMKKALTYDPKHQLAHFNLGIVNLQIGNIAEANSWFKKCADINPNSETGKRAGELYHQHQFTNVP